MLSAKAARQPTSTWIWNEHQQTDEILYRTILMGWETANVHLGTRQTLSRTRENLRMGSGCDRQPAQWRR